MSWCVRRGVSWRRGRGARRGGRSCRRVSRRSRGCVSRRRSWRRGRRRSRSMAWRSRGCVSRRRGRGASRRRSRRRSRRSSWCGCRRQRGRDRLRARRQRLDHRQVLTRADDVEQGNQHPARRGWFAQAADLHPDAIGRLPAHVEDLAALHHSQRWVRGVRSAAHIGPRPHPGARQGRGRYAGDGRGHDRCGGGRHGGRRSGWHPHRRRRMGRQRRRRGRCQGGIGKRRRPGWRGRRHRGWSFRLRGSLATGHQDQHEPKAPPWSSSAMRHRIRPLGDAT